MERDLATGLNEGTRTPFQRWICRWSVR